MFALFLGACVLARGGRQQRFSNALYIFRSINTTEGREDREKRRRGGAETGREQAGGRQEEKWEKGLYLPIPKIGVFRKLRIMLNPLMCTCGS